MDNIFTRFAATVKTLIRLNEINEKESGRGPNVLTASKLMKLFSKKIVVTRRMLSIKKKPKQQHST